MFNISLSKHNLVRVGVFTYIYCFNKERVQKVPTPDPNNLNLVIESIQREG